MAFCKNCGTSLPEGATFCSSCGTPVDNAQATQQAPVTNQPVTAEQADIQNNKVMAVLAYIGILVLIPIFAAKDSKYAQYHAKQGTTLWVLYLAYLIATGIIKFLLGLIFKPTTILGIVVAVNPIVGAVSMIFNLASIFFLVLAIIGIVNACKGEEKELPLIGKIDVLGMIKNLFGKKA